jgi:hypothetical protein
MFRQILVASTGHPFDATVFQTARAAALGGAAHLHVLFARPDPADAAISMAGGAMDGGATLAALIEAIAEEDRRAEAAARVAWTAFSTAAHPHGLATTLDVAIGAEGKISWSSAGRMVASRWIWTFCRPCWPGSGDRC